MEPIKLSSELTHTVEIARPKPLLVPAGHLGCVVTLQVRDTLTKKLEQERQFVSKSFLKGFLQTLWFMFGGDYENSTGLVDPLRVRTTAGTYYITGALGERMFSATAGAAADTYGIQVGLSNAAPTINDYALTSKCSHGVGLNQFQYGAVTYGLPTDDGVTSQFTITRDFANASGNPITVEEIGVVVTSSGYVLIIHDVTGSIVVANGKTLTVNYQEQANV